MKLAIVTTTHWEGDPRLNRHQRYLRAAGLEAELEVATGGSKLRSLLRGIGRIMRSDAEVVVLPDPELFVIGSLVARMSGKRPVLDIHEDYPKTAAERAWIPRSLRPVIRGAAAVSLRLGRLLASKVLVAAPELANAGDILVMNIPDPTEFDAPAGPTKNRIVYVGDVTPVRGAAEMVELLAELPEDVALLVIGRIGEETSRLMTSRAADLGVAGRLELAGLQPHPEAWGELSGSLAGLSLLQPAPAYLHAVATKIWEYMAAGIPPVVSDLPGQAEVVRRIDPALVCSTTTEAASVITRLAGDPSFREKVVVRGRALVEEEWERKRPDLALQEALAP